MRGSTPSVSRVTWPLGREYGVSSTPTIFINGRTVMGALPFEAFDQIIQEELAATQR